MTPLRERSFDEVHGLVGVPAEELAGQHFRFPSSFPEGHLYALLLWKTGPPRGFFTLALPLGGDPDAPFKWDFTFRVSTDYKISIFRSWLGLHAWVNGPECSVGDLLTFLGRAMKSHKGEITETLKGFEEYTVMVNPVVRYRNHAEFADRSLRKLKEVPIVPPPDIHCRHSEKERHARSLAKHMQAMDEINFFASQAVLSSAFWVESYLNVLITLLARPEVKENGEEFSAFLRASWRAKLNKLSIYCLYIEPKIDFTHDAIKSAKQLFELRNHLAHGTPDPQHWGVGKMYFHGRTPMLPDSTPYDVFQTATTVANPSRSAAHDSLVQATAFADFLELVVLEPVREQFRVFRTRNPIGFNHTKQMLSIPFDHQIQRAYLLIDKKN